MNPRNVSRFALALLISFVASCVPQPRDGYTLIDACLEGEVRPAEAALLADKFARRLPYVALDPDALSAACLRQIAAVSALNQDVALLSKLARWELQSVILKRLLSAGRLDYIEAFIAQDPLVIARTPDFVELIISQLGKIDPLRAENYIGSALSVSTTEDAKVLVEKISKIQALDMRRVLYHAFLRSPPGSHVEVSAVVCVFGICVDPPKSNECKPDSLQSVEEIAALKFNVWTGNDEVAVNCLSAIFNVKLSSTPLLGPLSTINVLAFVNYYYLVPIRCGVGHVATVRGASLTFNQLAAEGRKENPCPCEQMLSGRHFDDRVGREAKRQICLFSGNYLETEFAVPAVREANCGPMTKCRRDHLRAYWNRYGFK